MKIVMLQAITVEIEVVIILVMVIVVTIVIHVPQNNPSPPHSQTPRSLSTLTRRWAQTSHTRTSTRPWGAVALHPRAHHRHSVVGITRSNWLASTARQQPMMHANASPANGSRSCSRLLLITIEPQCAHPGHHGPGFRNSPPV